MPSAWSQLECRSIACFESLERNEDTYVSMSEIRSSKLSKWPSSASAKLSASFLASLASLASISNFSSLLSPHLPCSLAQLRHYQHSIQPLHPSLLVATSHLLLMHIHTRQKKPLLLLSSPNILFVSPPSPHPMSSTWPHTHRPAPPFFYETSSSHPQLWRSAHHHAGRELHF